MAADRSEVGWSRAVACALVSALGLLAGVPTASAHPRATVRVAIEISDAAKAARLLDLDDVVRTIPALHIVVADVPSDGLGALAARLRVAGAGRVEIDPPVHAAFVPNEPLWDDQWGPALVGAPRAWDRTIGAPTTVVAVLDTGVDTTHPDLMGALEQGTNLVDGNDDVTDGNGHGTAVAGIIGAREGNGVGILGYCWRCGLLPVKVLDDRGEGDSSTVAAGIVWAVDHGASVINLSLSSPSSSFPLSSAVTYADEHDVVVVAAAGNEGLLAPSFPASYPTVVGVAATDRADHVFSWSNRGRWAKIAAPGCHVATERGGGWAELCGTSSAAPAVAGTIALERSAAPDHRASTIVASLLSSARTIEDGVTASGRLDTAAAVLASLRSEEPEDTAGVISDDAPTAPRGLRVTTDDSAAQISWMAPDVRADAVTDYVVTTNPGGTTDIVTVPATSVTIGGLVNGLTYRFSVAARAGTVVGPSTPLSSPVTPSSNGLARVAGAGRVLTAVALSQRAFATAPAVVIARADDYADALAAAPLAARLGGPLLLSGSDGEIEPAIGGEIHRLHARVVHLIGGPGALSAELEQSLAKWGVTNVVRTAGRDRFDTARLIALAIGGRAVYVANGVTGWPDAVAASGLAAVQGRPILLVAGDHVPAATREALFELDANAAVIIGGTGSVPESLGATLSDPDGDGLQVISVSRIAGSDRYETSRRVADVAVSAGADPSRAWLASGETWPDALATGPAVAARGGVLLLIKGSDLEGSPGAARWLNEHAASLDEVVLVGGSTSINSKAEQQVQQRLARL